jgi:hypothetical protein
MSEHASGANESKSAKLERLFEHHQSLFKKTYDEAMLDFNQDFGHVRHKFKKSDYAMNMHVCVRHRVAYNFDGVPGAYIIDKPGKPFLLILLGSAIGVSVIAIIKFKKQSESLCTSNIQTKAVREFNTQVTRLSAYAPHIQLVLPIAKIGKDVITNPPYAKAANIIAGYIPNTLFTAYNRLPVALPLSRRKAMLIADIANAEAPSRVIQMPQRQAQQPAQKKHGVRRRSEMEAIDPKKKARKHLRAVEMPQQQTEPKKGRKDGEGG